MSASNPRLDADFLRLPIAHRALHGRGLPENSRGAMRAAVAAGYGIEIDVQGTADGQAVVFHDDDLDRLTGATGPVRARTAHDLATLRLTGCDETIPDLAEVLALVAGRVPLLIEIKDQTGLMGPTDGALEAAVAGALAGYAGPVAVMSFNPGAVAAMARLAPGVARGLTTAAYDPADWHPLSPEVCDRLRGIPDYDAVGASFISHEARDLARPRVADLRAQGAAVMAWTIRSEAAEAAARTIAQNVTFEGYPARIPA